MLIENNEVASGFTACPSGRIPWSIIIAEAEKIINVEDDMPTEKELENRAKADAIFGTAAAHIRQGRIPPEALRRQLQWLLAVSEAQD